MPIYVLLVRRGPLKCDHLVIKKFKSAKQACKPKIGIVKVYFSAGLMSGPYLSCFEETQGKVFCDSRRS
jgi:hypothetical protein